MILTAIVISMGIAAFVLALTYRSYRLNTAEEVSDDPEDTRVSQLAERDGVPLEDDRPEPDKAKDTDAPDELDALPGLEGSR
jgi:multicomponent Na+:H+ antiporter subunit C